MFYNQLTDYLSQMRALMKVLIVLISLQACIEPFNPDIRKYDNLLVVDAFLTNDSPAATVKLSRSFPYNSNVSPPETNAVVILTDESGTDFTLDEVSDGQYQSGPGLVPVIGNKYMLHIVTSDGAEFESDYQEMLKAVPVDSVYYSIDINDPHTQGSSQNGVNVYINSDDAGSSYSRYYKWEWDETWEIMPPFPYPEEQKSCWQSQRSNGIHIGTTENLVRNEVKKENLFFVPTSQNKLAVRYSVKIKQSALTRDNYIYLDKIRKINEGSGGFFDPIPGELVGNIRKVGNPDYPVLGIFEASEVKTKRIFIDRSDVKRLGYIVTGFGDCQSMEVLDSIYRTTPELIQRWWFLFNFYDSFLNDTLAFLVNLPKCYDCSVVGTKIKPAFWIDAPTPGSTMAEGKQNGEIELTNNKEHE